MSNGLWRTGMWRTRWAAIGAAVAVTLGAGGLFTASAAIGSGERTVFVPITPCRIMDTRPGEPNTGPRATPIGAEETHTIDVRGTNGQCTIPADAVGVSLNVTALNGTSGSFLTVFPADVTKPGASSLNWQAGQAPTPNGVVADLAADGRLSFFNFAGTVDVIADVVGYYADHNHDDRYYTEPEVDAALAAKANTADLAAKANTTDVNAALASKASTTDVNAALAGKANQPASGSVGTLLVGPMEFVPDDNTYDFFYNFNGTLGFENASSGCFVAPVALPDASTVTGLTLRAASSALDDITFRLVSDPEGVASGTNMALLSSGPVVAGERTLSTNAISDPVIARETHTYFLGLCMSDASTLYSARVDYTNP